MKKLLCLAISCAIAGCASPPEAPTISPYGREPINNEAAINEYRQQTAEESSLRRERTELQRQVEALQTQLSELKAYLILQKAADADTPTPKRAQGLESKGIPVAPAVDSGTVAPEKVSSVEIEADTVIFRVFHPYGVTQFSPPSDLIEPMLKAAREGKHIVIRGRTDSNYANDANQRVAVGRAVEAKNYLVKNGIDESKIRIFFMSAGAFIANNSTDEGKAKNRRVEVEAHGVDPQTIKSIAGV